MTTEGGYFIFIALLDLSIFPFEVCIFLDLPCIYPRE